MSNTNSLHYKLCELGAKYLKSKISCESLKTPNKYVAVELVSACPELTDVWATNGYDSTVLEIKVSHADFLKDKKKFSRINYKYSMGNYRYYLCPTNIISKDEVPKGWGLLYYDGKRITKVLQSEYRENGSFKVWDVVMLSSILSRISKPQVFNFRNKK